MALKTITSVNSVLMLAVPLVFPVPQKIQGFSADTMFMSEPTDNVETVQGIDGVLSAGFVYNPTKMSLEIMPNSPSFPLLQAWDNYQNTVKEVAGGSASIVIPSIGQSFIIGQLYLTRVTRVPGAKRTLQPLIYELTCAQIIGAPL